MNKTKCLQNLKDRLEGRFTSRASSENYSKLQKWMPRLSSFLLFTLLSLYGVVAQAAPSGTGDQIIEESNSVLCTVTRFIRGPGGWIVIAIGFLMIGFDILVQKQTHLLVIGIVAVITIVVLGKALCNSSALADAGGDCGC